MYESSCLTREPNKNQFFSSFFISSFLSAFSIAWTLCSESVTARGLCEESSVTHQTFSFCCGDHTVFHCAQEFCECVSNKPWFQILRVSSLDAARPTQTKRSGHICYCDFIQRLLVQAAMLCRHVATMLGKSSSSNLWQFLVTRSASFRVFFQEKE